MSSVAYNLSRKLEWMSRRIRRIDVAGEIKDWVEAMSAINSLLNEVDVKEYNDDWRPWNTAGTKQKHSVDKGLNEGILKKDLNERSLNGNDATQTPQKNRDPPVIEMEVDGAQAKKDKILQMLMPQLRSPISLKPKASRKFIKSRHKIVRGFWGIKTATVETEVKRMEVNEENKPGETSLSSILKLEQTGKSVGTGKEEALVVKKVKSLTAEEAKETELHCWRQALYKKLNTEDKKKEHWGEMKSASFEQLLSETGNDDKLNRDLKDIDSTLIAKDELRRYLYREMINFYAV